MRRCCARSLNVAKQKVLAIVGPTASGKSALAIRLAKALNGEIISADSMQVYKGMDIGTAKITPEEMEGIPHFLIDIQKPNDPYNVRIFQQVCREAIENIASRGRLPIICGGTGLYLKGALYDYDFPEDQEDPELKEYLESLSNEQLWQLLEEKDPSSLSKLHINNRKRLLRAATLANSPVSKSEREDRQSHQPLYDVLFLGLDPDRDLLEARIEKRVDQMMKAGLPEEVRSVFQTPESQEWTSFQGIGYKEFKQWLNGEDDLNSIRNQIIIHTRQYAKRQMTWFRHQMPVVWIDPEDPTLMGRIEAWLSQETPEGTKAESEKPEKSE